MRHFLWGTPDEVRESRNVTLSRANQIMTKLELDVVYRLFEAVTPILDTHVTFVLY